MAVTTFQEMKVKRMGDLLSHFMEQVASGRATGLVVVAKLGERHHGIGIVGEYLDDPSQVHAVTARIDYRVNQLIDERLKRIDEGEQVVDFKPKE